MTTKKYRETAEKLFTTNPEKYMAIFDSVKTLALNGVIDKAWIDYIVHLDRRFALDHYKDVIKYYMEVLNDE